MFQVSPVMLWITILPAANVTFELSDSSMLRHVTTQVWRRLKSFAANLTPVRVASTVCGFMSSQGVQTRIAPMTLGTLVFSKARATRICALQKTQHNTDFADTWKLEQGDHLMWLYEEVSRPALYVPVYMINSCTHVSCQHHMQYAPGLYKMLSWCGWTVMGHVDIIWSTSYS